MSERPHSPDSTAAPHQAVGAAIQDLTAARLGRGFVPLAVLGITAVVETVLAGPGAAPLTLGLGAVAAAATMLAYGLRVTRHAFGQHGRAWMKMAMLGSLVPPSYALYVLGWRGLKGLFGAGGPVGVVMAVFFTGMGAWVMRSWMRVVEVERLAKVMAVDWKGGEG